MVLSGLFGILIALIIFLIVLSIAYIAINKSPIDPEWKPVIQLVILLLLLLALFGYAFGYGPDLRLR